MALRLRVIDNLGHEYETWQDWLSHWPQMYAAITSDNEYLKVLENYFGMDLSALHSELCQDKHFDSQMEVGWRDIDAVEACVQALKRKIEEVDKGDSVFAELNWLRIKMDLRLWGEAFEEPYFLEGGFQQDLGNVLDLLRQIKSLGAQRIKLCREGA